MAEWKECKIGDLCTSVYSGGTPNRSHSEYFDGGNIPWLNTGEISFNRIRATEKFITKSGLKNSSAKWVPANSVIVAMYGATAAKTAITKIDLTTNQACCNLVIDEKIADYRYIYYFLMNNYVRLASLANGGAQQNLNAGLIKNFEIDLPSLNEQKAIADVLACLDDKIELNERINKNLEEQSQAMFKSWFVDSLADSEETKLVSLADLMDYAGGSQPPASEFVFDKREGYIRFVQIRDYDNDSHITYIPESSKNKLCGDHDIMIARYGASLGRICFGINGAYNVALAKVFPAKEYYREFLRCYLSSREFYEGINNKGGRSAQAGFNSSDIKSFELPFPNDDNILIEFENLISPMFEKRLHLIEENRHLAKLRDTVLPKLMSGEIDVSTLDL